MTEPVDNVAGRRSMKQLQAVRVRAPELVERLFAMPAIARWTAIIGTFLLLLAARRPEGILRAEFIYEDGVRWYLESWQLPFPEGLVTPYAGYLHLIPRTVGYLETLVPVAMAPLLGNAIALLIVAAIGAFIASDRLAGVLPCRTLRLAIALYLVFLPTTGMTLGSITFVQFYLALFLIAAAVSDRPRSELEAATTYAAVALAAATGPFGLLLAPLFVGRVLFRRDTDSILMLVALGLSVTAQAVTLAIIGRPYAAPPTMDPVAIAQILSGHAATALLGGRPISRLIEAGVPAWSISVLGVVALAVVGTQLRRLPARWFIVGGYVLVAIIVPTLIAGSDDTQLLLDPLSASRYFMVPTALLGAGLIVALTRARRSPLSILAAAILVVGVLGDIRLKANPDYQWRDTSECIGGPAPCDVPVYPGGPWDVHWPGSGSGQTP